MDEASSQGVTALLLDWSAGDPEAPARLMPLVYDELRRLARSHLRRERADHTLQPTALVNEAFLRLVDQTRVNLENRAQFFGPAARLMRNILVDHARELAAQKRGGDGDKHLPHLSLDETRVAIEDRAAGQGKLDEAESFARELVTEFRRMPNAETPEMCSALTILGSVLLEKNDFDGAMSNLREGEALYHKLFSPTFLPTYDNLRLQAQALYLQGRLPEAGKAIDEVHDGAHGRRARRMPDGATKVHRRRTASARELRVPGAFASRRQSAHLSGKAPPL